MKKISALILVIGLVISYDANAWFFFFIPGRSGSSESGSNADLCYKEGVNVGDVVTSPSTGNTYTVTNVYGTSSRCSVAGNPIRIAVDYHFDFSSGAGINLPDDFEATPLTDLERFNGWLLKAKSNDPRYKGFRGININFVKKKDASSNIEDFGNAVEKRLYSILENASTKNPERFKVDGHDALRFEVTGANKGVFGTTNTYLVNIIDGNGELIAVNAFNRASDFENSKPEFIKIVDQIKIGNSSSPSVATVKPTAQSLPAPKNAALDLTDSKAKCKDLGFKPDTEGFGKCVLRLSK